MYALNNIFLLSLFVTATLSDVPTNIREKGTANKLAISNLATTSALAVNNTKKVLSTSVNSTQHVLNNQVITEGGSVSSTATSHSGREHVIESPATKVTLGNATESSNLTLTNTKIVIPVHDVHNESRSHDLEVIPHHDHEKSVPKKGVEFPDSAVPSNGPTNLGINKKVSNITGANISSKNSSTNNTVIYKKPLVTESDSDDLNAANANAKESTLTIDQIDPVLADKKSNRSDYIVPIVAVILSVPLVAILISMLYKRGTDWWQHRNYKRMDFLIEGMYHN